MNKRIFSVVLALVLALASVGCALAEEVASANLIKTTTAAVTEMKSSTGVTLPSDFAVKPVETTAVTKAVITGITEAASAGSLTAFFGANTMAEVAANVVGVNVANLKLNEAFPLSVANYDKTYGGVTVTMRLTKDYKDGDTVVALVGVVNPDGTITWTPVEATVVNGELAVTFTEDVLAAGATSELVFAVLSE